MSKLDASIDIRKENQELKNQIKEIKKKIVSLRNELLEKIIEQARLDLSISREEKNKER